MTNISLIRGRTFSEKGRFEEGKRSMILKTFCIISARSSLSLSSSNRAGRIFFSITDLGNDGSILFKPRIKEAFSLGVLAGKASRKRMVDTMTLSKYSLSWNSLAVIRCAGRRVIRRGSTWAAKSRGSGLDERNPFCDEGTVEDDEKTLL